MSSHQSGKAMLRVEKDGDSWYASAIPLTGVHTCGEHQWFEDAMQLVVFCDWLPSQCKRMKHGDRMTLKVTFEQNYYKGDGYTTDDDEEMIFHSARKLYHKRGAQDGRRRLKKYYQPKEK